MPFPNDQTKFKKGVSGNPNGRPRKLVSHINAELKEKGIEPISESQIREAFMMLINLELEEVKEIASTSSNYPFIYKLIAKELIGRRGADMLEKILDRGIGKARNHVETEITFKNRPDWLDAAQ